MKLISCHIDNFGKLHNKDFKFNGKLDVIREDNSWGKTTLATFVASMFYGLPDLRAKLISENDRRHYIPWQGGLFGGSLVFELNKKQYEIRRVFDSFGSKDKFSFGKLGYSN